MATLIELSEAYREAAKRLTVGIVEARERLAEGDELAALDIRLMNQMRKEMRELRAVTRDYYTKSRDPKFTMVHLKMGVREDG